MVVFFNALFVLVTSVECLFRSNSCVVVARGVVVLIVYCLDMV